MRERISGFLTSLACVFARRALPSARIAAALAVAALAAHEAQGVAKPKAVWLGDFPDTGATDERNGYTLMLNGNSTTDGIVTILNSSTGGITVKKPSGSGVTAVGVAAGIKGVENGSSTRILMSSYLNDSNMNRTMIGFNANEYIVRGYTAGPSAFGTANYTFSPANPNINTNYFAFSYQGASGTGRGTFAYLNGTDTIYNNNGTLAYSDTSVLGATIGGAYSAKAYNFVNAEISYVAVLDASSATDLSSDLKYWSLTDVCAIEKPNDNGSIEGGIKTGITLSGGTVTVSGVKTAAALFVQADTTLDFSNPAARLDITGPLYVADGATLTIDPGVFSSQRRAITAGAIFASDSQIVIKSADGYSDILTLSDTTIGFTRMTTSEAAAEAASATIGDYSPWSYANGVFTWHNDNGSPCDIGKNTTPYAKLTVFDIENGTDTENVYYGNRASSDTTTSYYASSAMLWNFFCIGNNYSAPGFVLRMADANKVVNASFTTFGLGGVIVESGASGCGVAQASGDGNQRNVVLGNCDNEAESWFTLKESFSFSRNGTLRLLGTVNTDISGGRTLSLNAATTTENYFPVLGAYSSGGNYVAGGCLKMHGRGQIFAKKLTASGACLDYSDLSASRTYPYIDAQLVVDSATTYKFPALSGAATYRLATSLAADATHTTSFSIGGNEYTGPLTFTAASGTVTFPAVATLAAGTLETPKLWDTVAWDAGPATVGATTPVIINVTDDTYLAATTALSFGSLTFNIAPGKTLLFVPNQGLTTASGFTVTGGGTLKLGMNTVINGDMTVAGDATLAYHDANTRLTVNGTLSVASGATLTFAPATISGTSATLATATTLDVSGSLAVFAPDSANIYELDTTTAANTITLKRTPAPAKICNASVSGWSEGTWGTFGAKTFENVRVGPSADFAMVAEVTSGFNPWVAFPTPTATGWSFSVYADVSKTSDSTTSRPVLACFGDSNSGNTLLLYREGSAVKLGWYKSGAFVAGWEASVSEVSAGFHLYTFTCDPTTGKVTLYVDGGSASSNDSEYLFGTMDLPAGFQLGKAYGSGVSGFATATGMAVAAFMYYDSELNAAEVAALAAKYPATDGTVICANIDNKISESAIRGSAITVYSSTAAGNQYLGVSGAATLNIPAGETVNVPHFRTQNVNTGNATVNINGTVNVTSTSSSYNVYDERESYKGILFGHWNGAGTATYNIGATGALVGENAWLQTVFGSGAQTINVSGGTLKVKGLYSNKANNSTVALSGGGLIEVGETTTQGQNIAYSFGNGTYRQKATGTVKGTVAFTGTAAAPTTLDPYGCEMTVPTASSEGYVTVADSSTGENKGKVYFTGSGGCVILTDENAALFDISGYTGKVLVRSTSAATLAKLGGFAGVVKIDTACESAYDFREVDLSRATVELSAAGATFIATAGQEGSVTAIAGAVQLYASNQIFLYDGHVFTGGINTVADAASLTYIHSEVAPEGSQSLTYTAGQEFSDKELAEVLADNSLVPYYYIFTGDSSGETGTLSTAAHWGNLPDNNVPTSGNIAIRVENGNTLVVDVDNTTAFGEVQIYGDGNVVLQGSGAMTVSGGIYLASTVTLEIQGGVAFGEGAGIHVQAGSTATVNCGTSETPFVVPYVGGYGTVAITADANATVSGGSSLGAMTVAGTVAFSGAVRITNLSIAAGAIANVANAVTLTAPTLAVDGELNMLGATSTLSDVTSLSGTGTVVYNSKLPDNIPWTVGTETTGWRGTVVINNVTSAGLSSDQYVPFQNYGNEYSYLKAPGFVGYTDKANPPKVSSITLVIDEGTTFNLNNGNSTTGFKFAKLLGEGTLMRGGNASSTVQYIFSDVTGFRGDVIVSNNSGCKMSLILGPSAWTADYTSYQNKLGIAGEVVIADGKNWTSEGGIKLVSGASVTLLGAGTLTGPVSVSGAAQIALANEPLAISGALTFDAGGSLAIDPGSIAISTTAATLVTGLTAEPDLTNVTVVDAALTAVQDAETEKWSICATLADGVWNTGSGSWTASSFNGTAQETDGADVKFRASANAAVTVTLDGTRAPANVTFRGGEETAYTLTGDAFEPTGTVTVESGSVTIESAATGTYVVNAGATLVLKEVANATISGNGTIVVPQGTTCVFDGVTCSAKVVVEGTLQTKGTTNLSGANTSAAGSLVEVVSGATTLATAQFGIFGDITIGSAENSSAQLTMGASLYEGTDQYWYWLGSTSTTCIDIYGTLALGERNLILTDANTVKLRNGATITGNESIYGNLAFTGNGSVQVYGNATIDAYINSKTGTSPVFTIEENATLTLRKAFVGQTDNNSAYNDYRGGSLTKAGAGTLDLTAITMSKPLTINAGTVVSSAVPTGTVTINENGQFTLKNCAWTGSGNVFQGTGTLCLDTSSDRTDHSVSGSTFSGILKISVPTGKVAYFNSNPESQLTGRPELVLEYGTQSSFGSLWVGAQAASKFLKVRNFSGWGSFVPWSNVTGDHYIETTQEKNTEFSGTFVDWGNTGNYRSALTVKGGDTVKSLTLSGANTTTGPLIIDAYGKVIFSDSGSWLNGTTTVKSGGVLESQRDAQVVGALTLEAGATLSFAEGYSLQTGAITLPDSGTVTLDISALTLSASGTTLIQSSSITTSTDLSKFSVSDGYYLKAGSDVLMVFPLGASLTYTEGGETTTTSYATINDAISAAYMREYLGNTYDYITAYASGSAIAYASTVKVKLENGAVLTLAAGSEEYSGYSAGTPDADGIVTYTVSLSPTTYVWSNPNGGNWNLLGNWKYIDSNDAEQDASRYPQAGDTVIFNDGASVTHSTAVTVAGITVNGSVAVFGSSSLETSGNITGSGTLSINGGGIASAATGLTVAPNVVFAAGTYIACGSGGGSLTFNGNVSLPAGTVSLWNSGHTFAGTTTLNGDYSNGGNQTLTLGAVSVAASSSISGRVVFGGAITIDSGITLTTPASNVSFSGASLSGTGTLSLGAQLSAALTTTSWTGTVVLPNISDVGDFRFDYYGRAGSTVKIDKGFRGWLHTSVADAYQVKVNILLADSDMTITGTSAKWYQIAKLSGTGNFTIVQNATYSGFQINNLENYSGTLANNPSSGVSPNTLKIVKQTLSAAPSAGDRLVATTTPNNLTLSAVYVGDAQQTNLILAKREDGIYVAAVEEAVTVGEESVTSLATASWATELDATGISGKVAIPGTVTQITGVTAANLLLKATYTPKGGSETTAYYPGILALDASGNVSLNSAASATVGSETVSVAPALDTDAASPMAVADAVPSFVVKTVPGLWYKVVAGTAVGEEGALGGTSSAGTAVQATSTSTTVAAPAFPAGANVLYYKIGAEL